MDSFARADKPHMLRFLKETWLPTAMFAGLGGLIATGDRDKGVIHWAAVIAPLIVVPLVWKSFVIRQGRPRVRRAAVAGSASAFMILFSDMMIDSVRRFIHSRGHASEELAGLLDILVPFMMLIGFLLGAGVASLVAFVQARVWPGPPEEPGTADLALDGAVGGALVATLAAPFVAPFAAIPLASFLDQRAPGMDLFTATAGTWLVLVPACGWLGVKAVRRWRRILGEGDGANGRREADRNL